MCIPQAQAAGLALVTVLALGAVPPPASGEIRSGIEFLRAHRDGDRFRIQTPVEVDWRAFGPRLRSGSSVSDPSFDTPLIDPASLQRIPSLRGDVSSVQFDVPDQPFLCAYHYYLLSSEGVVELSPLGLEGTLSIEWASEFPAAPGRIEHDGGKFGRTRPRRTKIAKTRYSGAIVATPLSPSSGAIGGIVVASERPRTITLNETAVQLMDILDAGRGCAHSSSEHADEHLDGISVVARSAVTIDDKRYIFVGWSPQPTCSSDEPDPYFLLVDESDLSREIGFSTAISTSVE